MRSIAEDSLNSLLIAVSCPQRLPNTLLIHFR
jgi:hypothetical protein